MVHLDGKSSAGRAHLFHEWATRYQGAVTLDDKEIVRVKFFDAIGKDHGFNARMTRNLRLARAPHGTSALDDSFMRTMKDIFIGVDMPKPVVRGCRR